LITLEVPFVCPSVNAGYSRGRNGRRFSTKAVKTFKNNVRIYVQQKAFDTSKLYLKKLRLKIWIGKSWITKSGLPRKSDVSNYLKFSEDSFLDALGIDDKNIFEITGIKVHSENDFTRYELTEL